MELRHLRYFVAVAEEQNVTRAAARLRVSQPPLSRQIRDLEDELGVQLFARSAKSVRLTEEGRLFLGEARAVLQRVEEAVRAVRAMAGGGAGELLLGYAPSPTVEVLPPALAAYQAAMPGVRVTLRDLSTEEMLAALRDRRIHLGLMVRASAAAMRGLIFHPLRSYAVHVAVSPVHPLAHAGRITLEQIAAERIVGYTMADYPEYHAWLERLLGAARKKLGARSPLVAEEHDSATSLIAAVEAGRGIALVPQSFACFAGPRVVLRPITPSPGRIEIGVAHLEEKLGAAAAKFVEVVKGVPVVRR
jgi:DNA-binding transcriptional LysR family regulator